MIENLEKKYLDKYYHFLMYAKDTLFEGFRSANDLRDQWENNWEAEYVQGAERIVYSFFNSQGFGKHNSNPVSSDLFFQTEDAFIHIDLKTTLTTNKPDLSPKHDIEQNQSSYQGPIIINSSQSNIFKAQLPTHYKTTNPKNQTLPCLTYFVVIIFEKDTFEVPCMYITCVPNGLLKKYMEIEFLVQEKEKISMQDLIGKIVNILNF
jgi:hypothetical protein